MADDLEISALEDKIEELAGRLSTVEDSLKGSHLGEDLGDDIERLESKLNSLDQEYKLDFPPFHPFRGMISKDGTKLYVGQGYVRAGDASVETQNFGSTHSILTGKALWDWPNLSGTPQLRYIDTTIDTALHPTPSSIPIPDGDYIVHMMCAVRTDQPFFGTHPTAYSPALKISLKSWYFTDGNCPDESMIIGETTIAGNKFTSWTQRLFCDITVPVVRWNDTVGDTYAHSPALNNGAAIWTDAVTGANVTVSPTEAGDYFNFGPANNNNNEVVVNLFNSFLAGYEYWKVGWNTDILQQ